MLLVCLNIWDIIIKIRIFPVEDTHLQLVDIMKIKLLQYQQQR